MSNSSGTDCTYTGNCTVLDGGTTNGTVFLDPGFDPVGGDRWHQRMELITICVVNSLSLLVIAARILYRWLKLKRFQGDDRWMAVAGIALVGYTVSLIGTNVYGSGLHADNVDTEMLRMHWHFTPGWAGYYVVATCIKMSVCSMFMELLPEHLKTLRRFVIGLSVFIASLGITMTLSWLFECTPFLSNFLWSVQSTSCVNYDIFRWLWIALSILVDLLILAVPVQILKHTQIRQHEKRILRLVFSATLLGTITCALGIYGVYETRVSQANDTLFHEVSFMMMNDIEIFMYAIGASFPVLSRYLVARSTPDRETQSNFSSWARHVPDFFLPTTKSSRRPRSASVRDHADPQSSIKSLHSQRGGGNKCRKDEHDMVTLQKVHDHLMTESLNDLERAQTVWIKTEVRVSDESKDGVDVGEYIRNSQLASTRW